MERTGKIKKGGWFEALLVLRQFRLSISVQEEAWCSLNLLPVSKQSKISFLLWLYFFFMIRLLLCISPVSASLNFGTIHRFLLLLLFLSF